MLESPIELQSDKSEKQIVRLEARKIVMSVERCSQPRVAHTSHLGQKYLPQSRSMPLAIYFDFGVAIKRCCKKFFTNHSEKFKFPVPLTSS